MRYVIYIHAAPVGPPSFISTNVTATTVHLQWKSPFDPDSVIESYAIVYQLVSSPFALETPRPEVTVAGINSTSHKLQYLLVSSTYKIFVLAVYSGGNGPESESINITTNESGNLIDMPIIDSNDIDVQLIIQQRIWSVLQSIAVVYPALGQHQS